MDETVVMQIIADQHCIFLQIVYGRKLPLKTSVRILWICSRSFLHWRKPMTSQI